MLSDGKKHRKFPCWPCWQRCGFTLIECLMVLGIVSILLLVAVPTFHDLLGRNKTSSIIDNLSQAIYFARNEAIKQGQTVTFCGSNNGQNCDGHWSEGQIVVVDHSHRLLRSLSGLPKGDQLIWRSNLAQNEALKFTATGFTAGQNGSFYYCKAKNSHYKNLYYDSLALGAIIVINQSGRLRIDYDQERLQANC